MALFGLLTALTLLVAVLESAVIATALSFGLLVAVALMHRRVLEQRVTAEEWEGRDELLALISHELRGPLNVVLGGTRMLLNGRLQGEGAKRVLEMVERNALAQVKVLDELAGMESGHGVALAQQHRSGARSAHE